MNVRKMLMRSTCQTMVREEAATAYTKYLHMRKIKSDDMSWQATSNTKYLHIRKSIITQF